MPEGWLSQAYSAIMHGTLEATNPTAILFVAMAKQPSWFVYVKFSASGAIIISCVADQSANVTFEG